MDSSETMKARALGRAAAEGAARAYETPGQLSRMYMKVTGVSGGTASLSGGGAALSGVPYTTGCIGIAAGKVAVVDVHMHRPLIVGVLA